MPINKHGESIELEFGGGDIEVGPGLLDTDSVVGALCFAPKTVATPVGTRTDYIHGVIWPIEETPVRMIFSNTMSADVVIQALIDMKQYMSRGKVSPLQSVIAERQRQGEKWGQQDHDPTVWMGILGEEFGELCQAVNETHFNNGPEEREKGGYENMRSEAVQVAAVAVSFIEALDRRYGRESV